MKLEDGEMPRQARIISDTGIYHIMTRGIKRNKFLKKINKISKASLIKQKEPSLKTPRN